MQAPLLIEPAPTTLIEGRITVILPEICSSCCRPASKNYVIDRDCSRMSSSRGCELGERDGGWTLGCHDAEAPPLVSDGYRLCLSIPLLAIQTATTRIKVYPGGDLGRGCLNGKQRDIEARISTPGCMQYRLRCSTIFYAIQWGISRHSNRYCRVNRADNAAR